MSWSSATIRWLNADAGARAGWHVDDGRWTVPIRSLTPRRAQDATTSAGSTRRAAYAKIPDAAGRRRRRAHSGADRAVRAGPAQRQAGPAQHGDQDSRRVHLTRPPNPRALRARRRRCDPQGRAWPSAATIAVVRLARAGRSQAASHPRSGTACLSTEGGSWRHGASPTPSGGLRRWHARAVDLRSHDGSVPKLAKAANCDVWSPFWRNVTAEHVREARALGLAVLPWTRERIRPTWHRSSTPASTV